MPRHSPCALIRLTFVRRNSISFASAAKLTLFVESSLIPFFFLSKFDPLRWARIWLFVGFTYLQALQKNPSLVSLQFFKNYAGSIRFSFSWNCISITLKFFFLTVAFSLLLLHSMFSFQGTSSSKQTPLIPFPSAPFGPAENSISLCCFSSPIKTRFAGLLIGLVDGWVKRLNEASIWLKLHSIS